MMPLITGRVQYACSIMVKGEFERIRFQELIPLQLHNSLRAGHIQGGPKRIIARVCVWNVLHHRGDAVGLLVPKELGYKCKGQIQSSRDLERSCQSRQST